MVADPSKLLRIPVDLLQRHDVHIPSDTPFQAAARLQALYREDHNLPIGGYMGRDGKYHSSGSRLAYAAVQAGANYLTPAIAHCARHRIAADNLLSSRPLTYNLLTPLAQELTQASCYLNELLLINTARVQQVVFEYKPWVSARTIWDCFISYQDGDGRKGFVAIEVKFKESLNHLPQFKREHLLAQSLLDSGVYD